MNPRVYLAGPDVFFPDPHAWAERKRRICGAHGLVGVMPLDPAAGEPELWVKLPEPDRIARRNEAHIRACDAVIANLTPFRGGSADSGTVYEVGFARGLGRPVFGYTNTAVDFATRTRAAFGSDGIAGDSDGLQIESFGLHDNLMIECAVREAGALVVRDSGPAGRWTDLAAFTECVQRAARQLSPARHSPAHA